MSRYDAGHPWHQAKQRRRVRRYRQRLLQDDPDGYRARAAAAARAWRRRKLAAAATVACARCGSSSPATSTRWRDQGPARWRGWWCQRCMVRADPGATVAGSTTLGSMILAGTASRCHSGKGRWVFTAHPGGDRAVDGV